MHDQNFLKLDYNQLDKWILLEMTLAIRKLFRAIQVQDGGADFHQTLSLGIYANCDISTS